MSLQLTRTSVGALARTCPVENSPLADRFLAALKSRFGIIAEAVYLYAGRMLELPPGGKPERIFRAGQGSFVDWATLELYVHAGHSDNFAPEDGLREAIFTLFCEILSAAGEHIDYPRQYHPEELSYYGYTAAGFAREPIPTGAAKAVRHDVSFSYIDHLTLWHLLASAEKSLNVLPAVVETGATLRCFFDPANHGAPRPLALFATCPQGDAAAAITERLTDAIYAYLKPRDIRDALTHASVRPRLRAYNTLTDAERFALARG